MARPVLLVGSVPASSATEVFTALSETLGALAKRLPDGETGNRAHWIAWQGGSFENVPGLEKGVRIERGPGQYIQQYKVAAGAAATLELGVLGYAAAAIASYQEFTRLRDAGIIAAGTRFQICLPTPLAVVWAFVEPQDIATVWPAYERAMAREIDLIAASIPAEDFAVQWDIAVEPVFILGNDEMLSHFPEETLVASVARASAHVPAAAELGLHLCFGDTGQKYAVSADSLGDLVPFANRLAKGIAHKLAWVHFPAPPKPDYEKYFAPLKGLDLDPATEVYIGLVNIADGTDGAQARLDALRPFIADFGVAADCGLGRKSPEKLKDILVLHSAVAALA